MAHPGGRPSKLTDEIREQIHDYYNNCIMNGKVPTVAQLAVILDISKKTLYNWSEKDDELLHCLEKINTLQEATLIMGSLEGKLNAAISKLILSNHGYREKSEQDITSGGNSISPILVRFVGEDATDNSTDN